MASPEPRSDAGTKDARLAWLVGGILLLAATLFGAAPIPALRVVPGADLVAPVLYGAALLIFAFGFRGSGSVTALQPLGTAALTLLAAWTLFDRFVWSVVPVDRMTMDQLLLVGTVETGLRAAVAAIACVQIARAKVVPTPWNWAPIWVLIAVVTTSLLQQLVVAGNPAAPDQGLLTSLVGLDGLIRSAGAVFLGVLAIVLARRPSPERTVTIIAADE